MIGAGSGVGTTHLTLLLANYLAGFRKMPAAVLEWNGHGDFQRFGNVCGGISLGGQYCQILGADYFPRAGKDVLVQCMNGPYEAVVFDYGRIEEGNEAELIRCRKKLIVLSFSEWQIEAAFHFLKKPRRAEDGWYYFTAFGSEEARKETGRRFHVSIRRLPYLPDAYAVTKETINLFGRMWE